MKITKMLLLFFFQLFFVCAVADVSVRGYYKNNGTYVKPHERSNPNSNVHDNWSTKRNTNPHTGKEGTKDPDYY